MRVAGRLGRLRERLSDGGHEAMLVSNITNIRYLTGFTGSAALLLVLGDDAVFVSDGRYADQADEQLAAGGVAARMEITATERGKVLRAAATGLGRLAVEADAVTWAQHRQWADEWFPDLTLDPVEGLVERLRLRKDDGEVARIEAAAAIADEAFVKVVDDLGEGVEEREFALELDYCMRRLGADDVSFETICASGPNAAKPHARPGARQIRSGELVVLDFGALVDGYHSDMTRTLPVGEPTATQERMLAVVTEAQAAGARTVGPGVECSAVDEAARAIIREAGWGDAFPHGAGHGLGLDIHESPKVSSRSDHVLAAGEVVTVEPGIYLLEHGGVRVEDTLLVTADGNRPLTHAPKA